MWRLTVLKKKKEDEEEEEEEILSEASRSLQEREYFRIYCRTFGSLKPIITCIT
jgi:hypothetical protein